MKVKNFLVAVLLLSPLSANADGCFDAKVSDKDIFVAEVLKMTSYSSCRGHELQVAIAELGRYGKALSSQAGNDSVIAKLALVKSSIALMQIQWMAGR